MNKISWNIGCSGFHYKEWKGTCYKGLSSHKWFSFYARHFNSLESNVTFYRLPALKTLLKWYDTSPADFSFSVKAPQLITHYKKFNDIDIELSSFYKLIEEGFKDKLACVLFQFPPGFIFTEARLNNIINCLSNAFINVVEFRHSSWWQQNVFEKLNRHSIIFCNMSHPNFKDNFIETSPVCYFRFHGSPELYKSVYTENYLDKTIDTIIQNKKSSSAFLYFNNTMSGAAIENADYVKKILGL